MLCLSKNCSQSEEEKFFVFDPSKLQSKRFDFGIESRGSIRNFEPIFHFVKSEHYYFDREWLKQVEDIDNGISIGTVDAKEPKLVQDLTLKTTFSSTKVATPMN